MKFNGQRPEDRELHAVEAARLWLKVKTLKTKHAACKERITENGEPVEDVQGFMCLEAIVGEEEGINCRQ